EGYDVSSFSFWGKYEKARNFLAFDFIDDISITEVNAAGDRNIVINKYNEGVIRRPDFLKDGKPFFNFNVYYLTPGTNNEEDFEISVKVENDKLKTPLNAELHYEDNNYSKNIPGKCGFVGTPYHTAVTIHTP
ncbi:MAG TPA: hypothetical protein VKR58_00935, partial [Aquella sp.]|nr:hypothetical protein [Aquella sp.]